MKARPSSSTTRSARSAPRPLPWAYSLNTIDPTEMAAVEAMLTALAQAVRRSRRTCSRRFVPWTRLSIAWTGDGVQVGRDNEDARYLVATDGGELWIDSYTVAADAPHREAAYAFINYITQPPRRRPETEFCLFPHANDKATELVIEEVRTNPVIYPSPRIADQARVRGQRYVQQP